MAASLTPLVKFLQIIFCPLAYPIAKLLDYLFGHEEETANIARDELEALITLQSAGNDKTKSAPLSSSKESPADIDHSNELSKKEVRYKIEYT